MSVSMLSTFAMLLSCGASTGVTFTAREALPPLAMVNSRSPSKPNEKERMSRTAKPSSCGCAAFDTSRTANLRLSSAVRSATVASKLKLGFWTNASFCDRAHLGLSAVPQEQQMSGWMMPGMFEVNSRPLALLIRTRTLPLEAQTGRAAGALPGRRPPCTSSRWGSGGGAIRVRSKAGALSSPSPAPRSSSWAWLPLVTKPSRRSRRCLTYSRSSTMSVTRALWPPLSRKTTAMNSLNLSFFCSLLILMPSGV
mmetsp:Transcript_59379/g.133805  ORF Transcript_59379/g.133805 Transcript_59379/m.133805 type:complete len:253 (+) Transcript_59379:122-880(+)